MIKQKDIIADLHIHTIASLHAHSTLYECIQEAAENGMKYIAITDHYYGDGTELYRKNEVNRLANLEKSVVSTKCGVKVVGGAEFNISQNVDKWEKLKKLAWKLVGVHGWFLDRESTTLDELFGYFEDAANRYDVFAHIERELHRIDHCKYGSSLTEEIKLFLKRLVLLAKEKNIILELNESSLAVDKEGNCDRVRYWLSFAKQQDVLISIGTDSHYCEQVGIFSNAIDVLNEVHYPKEKVINCNEDILRKLFG